MKKVLIFIFLLFFTAFFIFSQEAIPGRRIFIDGTAPRSEQLVFFIQNFNMEMTALGYSVVGNRDDADYIFKFNVNENMVMYADGVSRHAPAGEPNWFIQISLIIKKTGNELISFSFPFTQLEEMYEYNQYLFYRVMINIPLEGSAAGGAAYDTRWQNKWLYINFDIDYRISYFALKPDNLYNGAGVYKDGIDPKSEKFINAQLTPSDYTSYYNIVYGLASFTLGVECQFLDFLSGELTGSFYFGNPNNYKLWDADKESITERFQGTPGYLFNMLNMQLGINIKYNFKMPNYMLSPYAGFNFVNIGFSGLPNLSWGLGGQIAFKAFADNAFYVNIGFQQFIGNTEIINTLAEHGFPHPAKINFNHFSFSVGFGIKIGFFDRKK